MAASQCPVFERQISTDLLSSILEEDEETKKRLVEIYNDVTLLLSREPDSTLDAEISAQYKDYKTLLDNYPKDLRGDERPIVVTGETSAGKSSVLNLLLGFNVLPTSTLACTGAVCRLRTSNTKKAEIFDMEDRLVKTIEMEDNDEKKFTKDLKDYISPKKKREEHQIQYVDIYWPIPFLRKNVIVVDTPGIGESEAMTERLVRYLPNAVALIYVIDSSRAGGIAKDRIVPLFKAIQGQDNNNGMRQAFDPSCAMFLCNKWDQVGEEEDDEVWEDTRNKLKIYWPNIQDQQIYRFSAKKILKKITKQKSPPEEFIKFKGSIEELIKMSLGAKSRQHIFWLEKFLMTIRMNLTSHLKNTTLSGSQRRKQVKRGEKLLKMLQDCCDTSKGKLQKEAEDVCQNLAMTINAHIHDGKNREEMFPWHKVRLPDKGDDLDEIKAEANRIIQNLVSDELNKCLRQYGGQDTLDSLMAKVRKETEGIRKARYGLEQLLQKPEEMDDEEPETFDDIKIPDNFDDLDFSKKEIAVIAVTSPLWFPLALVGGLLGIPVVLAVVAIKDKIQVGNYKREKEKYMTKWANKYLNLYTENSIYVWLKGNIFEKFYQNLDELFDDELPQTISGCRKLFDDLQSEVRSAESIRERYQPKLERCNQILEKLHELSSRSTYC